jgi:hypothetical protein
VTFTVFVDVFCAASPHPIVMTQVRPLPPPVRLARTFTDFGPVIRQSAGGD